MSGHADTIRAGILAPDGAPDGQVVHDALAALTALVAENQQLREAARLFLDADRAAFSRPSKETESAALRCRNNLRDVLAGTPSEDTG